MDQTYVCIMKKGEVVCLLIISTAIALCQFFFVRASVMLFWHCLCHNNSSFGAFDNFGITMLLVVFFTFGRQCLR